MSPRDWLDADEQLPPDEALLSDDELDELLDADDDTDLDDEDRAVMDEILSRCDHVRGANQWQ